MIWFDLIEISLVFNWNIDQNRNFPIILFHFECSPTFFSNFPLSEWPFVFFLTGLVLLIAQCNSHDSNRLVERKKIYMKNHDHNIRQHEIARESSVYYFILTFAIYHIPTRYSPVNVLNIHSNCIWDHKFYLWLSDIHKKRPSHALSLFLSFSVVFHFVHSFVSLSFSHSQTSTLWSIFMRPSHAKWVERKSDNSQYRIPNTRLQITLKTHQRSWFTVLSTHFVRYFHYFMQMLNLL